MVKVGFITDELTQDFRFAVELAAKLDARGLEVRSVWNKSPPELSKTDLSEIRRLADDGGCSLTVYCSPFGKEPLPTTSKEVQECTSRLHREIERAQILGVKYVRVFPFLRNGDPDPRSAAHAFAAILANSDVPSGMILVETGTISNTPTATECMEFFAELSMISDARTTYDLGMLWDPGNSIFSDYSKLDPVDELKAALPAIRHLHVKDPAGQRAYVKLGQGDVRWERIVSELMQNRYDGWLSLETHWRMNRELTFEERREPWGDKFSADGFQPTIECILELQRYING